MLLRHFLRPFYQNNSNQNCEFVVVVVFSSTIYYKSRMIDPLQLIIITKLNFFLLVFLRAFDKAFIIIDFGVFSFVNNKSLQSSPIIDVIAC